jgi:phosphoribosyl 1,2-cyclic phosphodiesterase
LIDCGLSAKQAALRLASIGVDANSIDAIIVTHEHRDHIQGVSVFSRRHEVPVYANIQTSEFIVNIWQEVPFVTGKPFTIKDVTLSPFRIIHDAVDPVGFRVSSGGSTLAVATDLGKATPLVVDAIAGCHALVLEANYDSQLLQECEYPWQVKQRIASSHGHLSNREAAELLEEVLHDELQIVVLGHLSENSNSPASALATVLECSNVAQYCPLVCASQQEAQPLFSIDRSESGSGVVEHAA